MVRGSLGIKRERGLRSRRLMETERGRRVHGGIKRLLRLFTRSEAEMVLKDIQMDKDQCVCVCLCTCPQAFDH